MPSAGRELYREFTGWAAWVVALVWIPSVASAAFALRADSAWAAAFVVGLVAALQLVFGGLLVTIHTDGIRVGLGRIRLFRTFLPFADVRALGSVTYRPMKEFGGWGLRGSREKRVWSARGNAAVRIRTRDGRRILIGSDEPEKLEVRIRNAMSAGGFGLDG